MTNTDAMILVGILAAVIFVLPCGIAFFPFLILRSSLRDTALRQPVFDPAALLLAALWRGLGWGLLFLLILLVPCAGSLFLMLGGAGGLVGWIVVWFQARSQKRQLVAHGHAKPRLQFGMTDLYLAVLLYGASMSLLLALYPDNKDRTTFVIFWTFCLLLAQGFAFYVALDLLRLCQPPFEPKRRAKYIAGIMLCSSVALPLVWLAWKAWNYALRERFLRSLLPMQAAALRLPGMPPPPLQQTPPQTGSPPPLPPPLPPQAG